MHWWTIVCNKLWQFYAHTFGHNNFLSKTVIQTQPNMIFNKLNAPPAGADPGFPVGGLGPVLGCMDL